MIPDPSYPTQQQMAQAMEQADLFVQQTRLQAQSQMMQQQAAFTGGIGGAQPGLMNYAGQAFTAFGGGFAAQMQQSAAAAIARMSMIPAAAAAMGMPALQQFGSVIEGARGATQRMSLTGILAAGFAPTSLFPLAGAAFNMEQRLVREMAREELGRRGYQVASAGLYQTANALSFGISGYLMRRSGLEASWLGEMESERSAQRALGYLRGGPYESATGFGMRREFFTRGAGRDYMRVLMAGATNLQSETGMNIQQIQLLTDIAQQAIDPTRGVRYQAGGRRGMEAMGREVNEIRRVAAGMAQSMQLAPEEIQQFFGKLRQVMEITGDSIRAFQNENRRFAQQGPFSLRQVAEIRMQGMQMGRAMYMGGTEFGTMAMQMAQDIANQRRAGVIRAETLLREGGGLDQEAMARMMMQRLQRQAQAVMSGNFNIALTLAGNAPQAYTALMAGGAGFFQTQAMYAATMIRNPFALQQAWMDPDTMRRVTAQAPGIAFQQAQQLGALTPFRGQQRQIFQIEAFGRQLGIDVTNAQGFNEARTRWEELRDLQTNIVKGLEKGYNASWLGADARGTYDQREVKRYSNLLMNYCVSSGATANQALAVLESINSNQDTYREFAAASIGRKQEMLEEEAIRVRAGELQRTSSFRPDPALTMAAATTSGQEQVLWNIHHAIRRAENSGQQTEAAVRSVIGKIAEPKRRLDVDKYIGGTVPRMNAKYNIKEQRVVMDQATGQLALQTRITNLNQDDLRAWMNSNHPKWQARLGQKGGEAWMQAQVEKYVASLGGKEKWEETRTLIRPGSQEYFDIQASIIETGKEQPMSRMEAIGEATWQQLERGGGAAIDLLKGLAGPEAGWNEIQTTLRNLDESKLKGDARLRPMVELAKMAPGQQDGKWQIDLNKIQKLDVSGMRRWFKEYAMTDSGAKVLEGVDVSRMGKSQMQQAIMRMSDEDKKHVFNQLQMQVIKDTLRLAQKVPLGEPGHPMSVELTQTTIEALTKG